MNRLSVITLIIILVAGFYSAFATDRGDDVDYPSAFRSWQHVKTGIIQPGHALEKSFGGIHHIYANEKAMQGLTGERYEEGAVLVFDLLDYNNSDYTIVEGARKRIDVMQYDIQLFADTGGWGYSSFLGDSKTERVEQDVATACYACHLSVKTTDYVFSQYRD